MLREEETKKITDTLLSKYPHKQWVIDAGALQMLEVSLIPRNPILTPHSKEFDDLWIRYQTKGSKLPSGQLSVEDKLKLFAQSHQCIVLLKGPVDIAVAGGDCDEKICKPFETRTLDGGNAGMTTGGTGDVLAGRIWALD